MMTERRNNDFLVGATVLIVGALFAAATLWLKQSGIASSIFPSCGCCGAAHDTDTIAR